MNQIVRPIEVIETEINFYKQQTATGIIEIGKRLIEAKSQLQHGEWGKWLEEKAEFTREHASRIMKVANEFGNMTSVSHLGTKKLFLLLDVPQEEREDFVEQNNVSEMTTRELQEAIKARKEAERRAQEAEENAELEESARIAIQQKLENEKLSKQAILEQLEEISLEKSELEERLEQRLENAVDEEEASKIKEEIQYLREKNRVLAEENFKFKSNPIIEVIEQEIEVEVVPDEIKQQLVRLQEYERKETEHERNYRIFSRINDLISKISNLGEHSIKAYFEYVMYEDSKFDKGIFAENTKSIIHIANRWIVAFGKEYEIRMFPRKGNLKIIKGEYTNEDT